MKKNHVFFVFGGSQPMYVVDEELTKKDKKMKNNRQLQSALLFLAEKKDLPDAVKLLIQAGVNPNIKTDFGNTPLILAALYDNVETVKTLLKFGADVNIKNQYKNNALMEMLDNDWINKITPDALRIAEILIKAGIDVNAKNNYDETALKLASKRGSTETVKLLLEAGADVNTKSTVRSTALVYAVEMVK